ncbi:MAG TPA: U32 family peptidase [Desulfurivibrio alkaliphilus]|uniref:U32 family peptidase n=1 Tax=Desulfurivibrio alkaliphilus TaxID=427923 RepID=A0A7C2TIH0_9BACT|nr:U32 family peptidase [Desulfurivibrio alkaliphilus]
MELLAPAGSLEAFEAAVAAGADAVYIGAPGANARALARDFTPAELAAMLEYAHGRKVKVYAAMNSLLKENELAGAAATVELLAALKIDALIIQDLGLYALCRRFFPQIRLHASTLLGAHNSLAAEQFAGMGFARVVLARELSLPEIAAIHRQAGVELEVFVHGAMCFSYSGLCLFSSYLGGKSGLRGRCVQPCRRLYRWADKSGYLFSMNDLDALELLPALARAGVGSVKIEGRMKSAQYVDRVVRAYRLVLDALSAPAAEAEDVAATGGVPAAALAEGRELLREAMGRRSGAGFFQLPPKDLVSPAHSGNVGLFLGKIVAQRDRWATLAPRHPLRPGDRLRLHRERSGERLAFTVKELRPGRSGAKSSGEGGTLAAVEILLPEVARAGDSLYKVDSAERRKAAAKRELVVRDSHRRLAARLAARHPRREIGALLGSGGAREPRRGARRTGGEKAPLPFWIKLDDPQLLKQRLPEQVARVVLALTPETLPRFLAAGKVLRNLAARTIWALPPVILEADLPFYREQIAALRDKGFHAWQIGHIAQIRLFARSDGRRSGPKRGQAAGLTLHGDYHLNLLNSLAWDTCKQAGLVSAQAAVEADRSTLALLGRSRPGQLGMTIHGRPPLFTARLDSVHFRYHTPLLSPRDEGLVLTRGFGQTLALADKPFSLLPHVAELAAAGLAYGVIDLRHLQVSRAELLPLLRQAGKKGRLRVALSNFNYLHGLE